MIKGRYLNEPHFIFPNILNIEDLFLITLYTYCSVFGLNIQHNREAYFIKKNILHRKLCGEWKCLRFFLYQMIEYSSTVILHVIFTQSLNISSSAWRTVSGAQVLSNYFIFWRQFFSQFCTYFCKLLNWCTEYFFRFLFWLFWTLHI